MTSQNLSALGWFGAALASASLLGGAAALALTVQPPAVLMLDLGRVPPAAPAIAAVVESAPQMMDEPPPPTLVAAAARLPKPPVAPLKPEVAAQSELALPEPEPEPAVAKPEPKPKSTKPAAKPKVKNTEPKVAAAPTAGATAKGGNKHVSPAAYAKAVLKKVRVTRKKTGAGRGVVLVGFTVSGSGALAGVTVLQSSGNAALDQIAIGHIQRAAPFPAPPEGAGRNFSFEFIGK